MKRFYIAATLLSTLLLASLTVFAQTQSRDIRTIRLLPREKYGDAIYQKNTRLPVAVGSFERKSSQDMGGNIPPDLPAGQAPTGGGGAPPAPNDGVLTNLADVPKFNGPDSRRVKKPIAGREGGAFYSFSRRTHQWDYGSDIRLDRGELLTGGAGLNCGLMTNIGDVPLDSVNLETSSVKMLAAYRPARKEPDARLESNRFIEGVTVDGLSVKSRLPLKLHSTYVVRSINYDESDVLVAFKVVEIESDGSAIIRWKLLKKYPTPRVARN